MEPTQKSELAARYNIRKMVGRLERKSPIRLWMEANREVDEDSAPTLFQALAQTGECTWLDRAVAFHILGVIELGPLEQDHAVRLLIDALKEPQIEKSSIVDFGQALALGSLIWLLLRLPMDFVSTKHFVFPDLPGICLAGLISTRFTVPFQQQHKRNTTKRIAATALASMGNPTCIAVLYHEARRTGPAQREALQALKAVLPSITGEWYGRLPLGEVALADLAQSPDLELALAALNALEQAGGGGSVRAVERLTKHAGSAQIRKRAAAVLPVLLTRYEQERAASTLLRASSNVNTENLVRPVYGTDPDTTHLLRASQAENISTPES